MTTCSQIGGAYAFKDVRKKENLQTWLRILACLNQYISNLIVWVPKKNTQTKAIAVIIQFLS